MPTKKRHTKKRAPKRPAPRKKAERSDFARIMAGLEKGVQPIKKTKESQYVVEMSFVSDRRLSDKELSAIQGQLALVVEEPSDEWATKVPEDHMSFSTKDVRVGLRFSRQRKK